jgi:hypothetical protein
MIVMFGSIVKGHWSGLLLVADMSGCYNAILLPGIICGGISYLASWRLLNRSIFDLPPAGEHQADVASLPARPAAIRAAASKSGASENLAVSPQEM